MEINIIPITGTTDKFIIYRPLIGLAFVGNHALAQRALQLAENGNSPPDETNSDKVTDFLNAVGFFQSSSAPPNHISKDFNPTTAVLLLANQCQLRCVYCYAAAGEETQQMLSFELGKTAIDFVYQNAVDKGLPEFAISYHGGGEPTYAWSVMKQFTEYARQKPLKAAITLTSNGIWSPKQREWIVNNFDGLSLSLDGSPKTQNSNRPLVSGRDSSDLVMETAAYLDKHSFPYGIRMTATAPWSDFPEDVRFLCEETGCQSMQVEPAFNISRGGHGVPQKTQGRQFAEAYMEAEEIATKAGRRLTYSGARLGMITNMFCTAPFHAIIVNANGELVTCYEVASASHPLACISVIGHIENDEIVMDMPARDHLHSLMNERRSTCEDCHCYWGCAGDCYARAFESGEKGHLKRGWRCEINRTLTERMLVRSIAASENGVWKSTNYRVVPHMTLTHSDAKTE